MRPIVYVGPRRFRSVLEADYNHLAPNFRRRHPRVVIGTPDGGKPSQHYNKAIENLIEVLATGNDDEISPAFEALSKLVSPRKKHRVATYRVSEDTINVVVLYFLQRIRFFGTKEFGFVENERLKLLEHELVHHELGNATPYREFRRIYEEEEYKIRRTLRKIRQLNISLVNEALAAAIAGCDHHEEYNGGSKRKYYKQAVEFFRRKRKHISKKDLISRVKKAIEEAWNDNHDVLEKLGIT